ncbi:MAG: helix-turn-helix transcriptional regulator [Polyangiaceae bacterium]
MAEQTASRLRKLREAAGLSVRELARQIGEDHSNVSFWERTGNLPRSNVLLPIAQALGVSVEELLGAPKPKASGAPAGKARQLFAAVNKLPRRQQEKIFDILQPFIRDHLNEQKAS